MLSDAPLTVCTRSSMKQVTVSIEKRQSLISFCQGVLSASRRLPLSCGAFIGSASEQRDLVCNHKTRVEPDSELANEFSKYFLRLSLFNLFTQFASSRFCIGQFLNVFQTGLMSATKRSLSKASEAFEINSRRNISLLV